MNIGLWFVKKKTPDFPNFVWFSDSVLTALFTFHRGIVRARYEHIGSWFISQIEKKSPNYSLNIVWFSESVLMALCTFQRGTVCVKNVNLKFWLRYILHRYTWRCGFYRQF